MKSDVDVHVRLTEQIYMCAVLTVPESVRCLGGSRADDEVRVFTDSTTQYRRTATPSLHGIPVPAMYVGISGTGRADNVARQTHSLCGD